MSGLTEEQKRKIEENRRLAKEKFEKRQQELKASKNTVKEALSDEPAAKKPFQPNVKVEEVKQEENKVKVSPINGYVPKIKVSFTLASTKEIQAVFRPFHQLVLEVFKTVPTTRYIREKSSWRVEIGRYDMLIDKLRQLKELKMEFDLIPPHIRQIFYHDFRNTVPTKSQPDLSKIDSSLMSVLFPYQKTGVVYGLEKQGRLLIADEMGLGKTLQALAIARYYANEWPLLIVCPSSVKYSWRQTIENFLPAVNEVHVIEKGSDPIPVTRSTRTAIIMSYDQMAIRYKKLVEHKLYVVIFDESHMLKDQKAKRTKAALELARTCQRRILLSGTPALSRPVELYSQMRIIDFKLFPKFKDFAERYCDGKQGKYCYEARGATNLEELGAILEKSVMIRRLKKNVLKDLPAKCRQCLWLTGSAISSKMNNLKKAREACEKANKTQDKTLQQKTLMEYYVETGIVKAPVISDYIADTYFYDDAPPVKLLIFAHHQIVLDTVTATLMGRKIKYIRIDGHTKSTEREVLCKKFQEDPETSAAILSITAAGVGITLTAANKVVFAELHWNPGALIQAEDRAHRVGQQDSVFVQYILARGSADETIWPMIESKLNVLQGVNLNQENFGDMKSSKMFVDKEKARIDEYFEKDDKKEKSHNESDSLDASLIVLDDD
ncbi:unnamed protein product [Bursaphelenchus okinawaensis]|uniref:SWI/SNF-related matrix-associated actin-dependent regulator of chromatin subfamily A-like protein 1 n=1 Tax=Bursaphelenchus okinawaensis TaxID=465554 RepID=A0A811KFD4_9BILA|nr:unnamed protein product [Bursaphelenchus okinawaensis]CAG9102303.1 unnamed protein product [Bursaphelenchus okinawaensis]